MPFMKWLNNGTGSLHKTFVTVVTTPAKIFSLVETLNNFRDGNRIFLWLPCPNSQDNVNIKEVDVSTLKQQIGEVQQNNFIMKGTIAENIFFDQGELPM